jgi:hypothetical protein
MPSERVVRKCVWCGRSITSDAHGDWTHVLYSERKCYLSAEQHAVAGAPRVATPKYRIVDVPDSDA